MAPLSLSFPERFLFRQARLKWPEMTHKQRPIKENKSRDRKTFFVFAMCVVDLGGRLGAEFCRKSVQEPSKVTASP